MTNARFTLLLGNWREHAKSWADGSFSCCLSDPPFAEQTHNGARGHGEKAYDGADSAVPIVHFDSTTSDALRCDIAEIGRLTTRWTVATCDWRHLPPLEQEPPSGMRFVRFGVWRAANKAPQYSGDRPGTGWEAVGIFHKAGGKMRWNNGGHHAFWDIPRDHDSIHPTQKPLTLYRAWVLAFTDPGDLVLDPWAGSAAVGIACLQLGRRYVGCELDPVWYAKGIARLQAQDSMPLYDPPVQQGLFGVKA